jgi:hypothetical protein
VIDRIAVSVGNRVITTSQIDRAIRVSALLNGVKADESPEARRKEADRLVEQTLVRRELELSRYPTPPPSEVEPEFAEIRKHYGGDAGLRDALARYGVTESDVRDQLLWQAAFLRFIDVRFRPGVQVSDEDIRDYFEKTVKPLALKSEPGKPVLLEDYRDKIEEALAGQRVNAELEQWLRAARRRTDVTFREEAFQ